MNLLLRSVGLFALLLVASCATVTSHDTPGTYGIDCSGEVVSIDVCYKKAASLCPKGYTVIKQQAQQVDFTGVPQFMALAAIDNKVPGYTRGITVQCKSTN